MFSEETLRAIEAHAIQEVPRECCGLVVVANGVEIYKPCTNMAASDEDFRLSHEDWQAAEDIGEIKAIVHSHPDESAEPTDSDKVACETQGLPWIIVSVREGKVVDKRVLTPTGWKAPLVGRNFFHGVLDCYTLIRDFYSRELGIVLPDFEREDLWWEKDQNVYLENFEKAGFRRLGDKEDFKDCDVLLMQLRSKVPNHGAIFLGDHVLSEAPNLYKVPEAILHHIYGRVSKRDVYGGFWRGITTHRLRHKDLDK